MAGDTGQGMTAPIFNTAISNVTRIDTNNTGDVIKETTADGVLTAALAAGWEFVITFIAPATGTHTLEDTIKAGETGSITIESGKTKYTSSAARSAGFSKSAPANGFITYSLTIAVDNDPTLAAVT